MNKLNITEEQAQYLLMVIEQNLCDEAITADAPLHHLLGGIRRELMINLTPDSDTLIRDGNWKDSKYPVGENYTNANAGDAEIVEYNGRTYEFITWNERAEDHEIDSISIADITFL